MEHRAVVETANDRVAICRLLHFAFRCESLPSIPLRIYRVFAFPAKMLKPVPVRTVNTEFSIKGVIFMASAPRHPAPPIPAYAMIATRLIISKPSSALPQTLLTVRFSRQRV